MKYEKLGEDINIPNTKGLPLLNIKDVKFNYYMSSRINGSQIDLDITSKIFNNEDMYVRRSSYRVMLGDIENCVKRNAIDHMLSLGLKECHIPASLKNIDTKNQSFRLSSENAFSN